jgi:Proteasome maturation factor UMP1
MYDSPKIPIVTKHDSALEADVNPGNLAIAATERHPVDALQRSGSANPYQDLNFVRSIYGSSLAMEMAAERQLARNEKAMGMSKIGGLYEDIVLGNNNTLQFSDFMSLPENRPDLPKSVFHVSMERHLKNI